jgi:hypothetical protein
MFCASRINLTNQEINDSIIALKQKIKDKKFVNVDLIENKLKYNLLKGKWNSKFINLD